MSKRINEFAETQKALRESEEARAKKLGGEVLAYVW